MHFQYFDMKDYTLLFVRAFSTDRRQGRVPLRVFLSAWGNITGLKKKHILKCVNKKLL